MKLPDELTNLSGASPLTPDTNIREIEDNIKVLLKQRISPPAQDLELLAYEITQLLTKAYSRGYKEGFAQGQFDKDMDAKYPELSKEPKPEKES